MTDEKPVDTMLVAAMTAAHQYREQNGADGITLITPEGVRTAPVIQTMYELTKNENMSTDDQEKWNSNTSKLQDNVVNDPKNAWFATKRNGSIDVWQVPLVTCKSAFEKTTSSTRPEEKEQTK